MRDFSQDHDWLSLNTATIRKQLGAEVPLDRIIDQCAARGIRAISPWRDQVARGRHRARSPSSCKAHGMGLSGYCRGGFFPAPDAAGLKAALEDNRRAIDEAKTLDAPCLVLVVGALPGALEGKAHYKDIAPRARRGARRHRGIARVRARSRHAARHRAPASRCRRPSAPASTRWSRRWTCATRSTRSARGMLGVALDIYHVWWDPKLEQQIARAGKERLLAYHVCDWLTPTRDLLNDRGMMGDGVVELRKIRGWVEAAGFGGFSEVEIFSALDWWQRPGEETLATCIERHRSVV